MEPRRKEKLRHAAAKARELRALSQAFTRWSDWADETRRRDLRGGGAADPVGASRAFARWVEWTDEVLDMRETLLLAVTRFAKRAMNAAFAKWAHITEVELNRKRILIEHVAKRMNRTVGFLFEQWWKYVDFELRMRATLEKAVKLMQNRVLGAAWGTPWAHCVEEATAACPRTALVLAPVDVQRRLVHGRERTREEARGGSEAHDVRQLSAGVCGVAPHHDSATSASSRCSKR